jgi:hypothetical protein
MKYKYLFLLGIFISCEALAADNLRRLFLTPEQRAQLDIVRARRDPRLAVAPEGEHVATAPAAPVPQGPDTVTYSGVVRRSDGKSTLWINGKAVDERHRIRGAHEVNVVGMRADGAVSVAIPQAPRTASLKVGQRLDVGSGRVEEGYARRETLDRPKASATPPLAPAPSSATTPPPRPSAPVAEAPTGTLAPILPAPRLTRPLRESDTKEADPESGAIPAAPVVRLPGK